MPNPVYGAPQWQPPGERSSGGRGSTAAPRPKTKTFTVGPKLPTKDEAKDWLSGQTAYENLAGNKEIADRALRFVNDHQQWAEQRMHDIREKWRVLDHILKGNSLSRLFPDSTIHVPELYKAVETIVPRLTEPIVEQKPFFKVAGRDTIDRRRAKKIEQWLQYQVDLNRVTMHAEEWARILVIYSFVAVKAWWHVEYQKRNVRTVQKTITKDGLPEYKVKVEEKEIQVYEGVKFRPIDPYRFLIDPDCTDPQDALFIGDSVDMNEAELFEMQDLGVFMNVDELVKQEPRVTDRTSSYYSRRERSLERQDGLMNRRRAEGQPKKFDVVEMWCKWRPSDEDEIGEYVITVANGTTVLRVQQNPYDAKHRPYAVARAAKEPFDFTNVGMLDHAIRLNIELDEHRMLALKSHGMSLCPITFVGSDFDGPTSLFDVEPGSVFHTNQTIQFTNSPSTIGQMQAMEETIRRDIDETIGSPRYFQGGGRSDTATEIERKVKEGNRRLRRVIFSFSDMFTQLLDQTMQLSAQYVSDRKKFRVMGKAGAGLQFDHDIAPEDFSDPVDVMIQGLRGVENQGLRGTQIATFLSQIAPFLPEVIQNGDLNVPALVQEVFESITGNRLDEQILNVPKPMADMMSPEEENIILAGGHEIEVHPDDNDPKHKQVHEAQLNATKDEEVARVIKRHIASHIMQAASKAEREAARDNPSPGPFRPGQMAEQRAGTQEGRYSQAPDLMGQLPNQTPPGETPGPARAQSTAAPDRQPAIPQTENRQ